MGPQGPTGTEAAAERSEDRASTGAAGVLDAWSVLTLCSWEGGFQGPQAVPLPPSVRGDPLAPLDPLGSRGGGVWGVSFSRAASPLDLTQ